MRPTEIKHCESVTVKAGVVGVWLVFCFYYLSVLFLISCQVIALSHLAIIDYLHLRMEEM